MSETIWMWLSCIAAFGLLMASGVTMLLVSYECRIASSETYGAEIWMTQLLILPLIGMLWVGSLTFGGSVWKPLYEKYMETGVAIKGKALKVPTHMSFPQVSVAYAAGQGRY